MSEKFTAIMARSFAPFKAKGEDHSGEDLIWECAPSCPERSFMDQEEEEEEAEVPGPVPLSWGAFLAQQTPKQRK